MTNYRLVQSGQGSPRALVVLFLVGPHMDDELRAILGPAPEIIATAEAPLTPTLDELRRMLPASVALGPLVLVGYSAGCQPVRRLESVNAGASAVVCIDGTHAGFPPEPWQIDVWRELAAEARRGERLFVATCSQQIYVEALPAGQRFSATRHVLEAALGQELPPETEVHEGALHVYSYHSASIDADAHRRQQTEALPRMLRAHVAPWLEGSSGSSTTNEGPKGEALPLGERLIAWYRAELAAGVHEDPPGSNTSPRIRQYLAPCRRRGTEQLLGLTAGAWCSACACFGLTAVALPGEAYPAPRAAGIELEQDAQENGSWHPVDDVIAGRWMPSIGDLVICRRGSDWTRHVCALATPVDAAGAFTTLGGNEGDRVRETRRALSGGEEPVLGFVSIAQWKGPDLSHGGPDPGRTDAVA